MSAEHDSHHRAASHTPGPPTPSPSQHGPKPATLVRNSGWGFGATAATLIVSGGVSIYAVRAFSETAWGPYSTAFALSSILTVLADMGLATLVLRSMAAQRDDEATVLGLGLRALFRTAALGMVAIIPLALLLG